MKISTFAMMIALASFVWSCGNKTSNEAIETPMEQVEESPEVEIIEEAPLEASDSVSVDSVQTPGE